jgi:predicted Zn-dependent peptidase
MLWGNHALGGDVAGNKKSVRTITGTDLREHTSRYYTPDKIVISVAGNVQHEDVVRQIAKLWDRVAPGTSTPQTTAPALLGDGPPVQVHRKRTAQANMILGGPALPYTDERRAVQDVLDSLLGAGMSSRLFVELRENSGLAYAISSFVRTYTDVGAIGIHAAVDDEKLPAALGIILRELDRICIELVGEVELRKVKEFIKGHTLLSQERSGNVAHWAGWQELMLGRIESVDEVLDRIEGVSPHDIISLANEVFSRERLLLALVGPFSDVSPLVDSLATPMADMLR